MPSVETLQMAFYLLRDAWTVAGGALSRLRFRSQTESDSVQCCCHC